nr:CopG family transcriptional regulator [uncultured Rhodopila sp.]
MGPLVEDERTESEGPARKQFLVHIDADVIRRVKILAIDRGVSASSVVQQAIVEFLSRSQQAGTEI